MKQLDNILSKFENTVNGLLMIFCVVVLFWNVCMRFFFHAASSWAEEALRYAIIWVTFFGGSQCAKTGLHVGIDILPQSLPPRPRRWLVAANMLTAAVCCMFCTYAAFHLTRMVMDTNQVSPAMQMPMWLVYISAVLGSGLMTIRYLVSMVQAIIHGVGGDNKSLVADADGNVDMSKL